MEDEMNQLEFKYLLLTQLSNYKKLEELLKNGETEQALKEIENFENIITETLNK